MFLIRRVDVAKSDFPDKISFGRAEDGRDFAIVVSKVEAGSAAEKVQSPMRHKVASPDLRRRAGRESSEQRQRLSIAKEIHFEELPYTTCTEGQTLLLAATSFPHILIANVFYL